MKNYSPLRADALALSMASFAILSFSSWVMAPPGAGGGAAGAAWGGGEAGGLAGGGSLPHAVKTNAIAAAESARDFILFSFYVKISKCSAQCAPQILPLFNSCSAAVFC
jgi:hypothetical protein